MPARPRICLLAAFAMLSAISLISRPIAADTVSLIGREQTYVSLKDRFVLHVPSGLSDMTVHIPILDSSRESSAEFGDEESVENVSVKSSRNPTRVATERDSGILYKVLSYKQPTAGNVTVEADFDHVAVTSDLTGARPSNNLPLVHIPGSAAEYMKPSDRVQSGDWQIVSLAHQIAGGSHSEFEVSTRIGLWMQSNIQYGGYVSGAFNDAISTLNNRAGICEGWAHLFIALARANGIPARFVGGYTVSGSIDYPIDQSGRTTMTMVTQSNPHGWVELWYPEYGWLPYEPQGTAGFVDSHHIGIWAGADSSAVLPFVTWDGINPQQVSFGEEQGQGRVTDNISIHYAGSSQTPGENVLLAR